MCERIAWTQAILIFNSFQQNNGMQTQTESREKEEEAAAAECASRRKKWGMRKQTIVEKQCVELPTQQQWRDNSTMPAFVWQSHKFGAITWMAALPATRDFTTSHWMKLEERTLWLTAWRCQRATWCNVKLAAVFNCQRAATHRAVNYNANSAAYIRSFQIVLTLLNSWILSERGILFSQTLTVIVPVGEHR